MPTSPSSDDELDTFHSTTIFLLVINQSNSEVFKKMTNFLSKNMESKFEEMKGKAKGILMTGSDNRCKVNLKNRFIVSLCVLYQRGILAVYRAISKLKESTFEPPLTLFVENAATILYEVIVSEIAHVLHINFLKQYGQKFRYYPFVLHDSSVF